MNYQHILREETKNGFDSFMDFLENDKNLLYEIDEEYIDEKEITVEIFDDIIIKFGRYLTNRNNKFDSLLGVTLSSDNQYAKRIEDI